MKLRPVHALVASAFLTSAFVFACAESATDIPEETKVPGATTENSQTMPVPSNAPTGSSSGGSSGSTTSSSGSTTSSSGSTTSSSGSTTSSSGGASGSSGGSAPACAWASDFQKVLAKMSEIQAGAPCDSTCNAATHCCLDLFGGAGGGGGSGGLPLDAGMGGSSGGGLPSGGSCVSNN